MWKQKFVLGISGQFGSDDYVQLEQFKAAGFDGYFINITPQRDLKAIAHRARELGLEFQSVHAPYNRNNLLWEDAGQAGDAVLQDQLSCLRRSAEAGTVLVVEHAYIGFVHHDPNQLGVDRFGVMAEEARKLGIRMAIENTEGLEYLETLMEAFKDEPHVGFCWDSGHEMCYTHSQDMLAKYGHRLFGTHLNDNLGIRRFDGELFWTDDLHLLPFDGAIDWRDVAQRLNKCGFHGPLTFELNRLSKPNRHENDKYSAMTVEQYLAEAYSRACRIQFLRNR